MKSSARFKMSLPILSQICTWQKETEGFGDKNGKRQPRACTSQSSHADVVHLRKLTDHVTHI